MTLQCHVVHQRFNTPQRDDDELAFWLLRSFIRRT